MRGYAVVGLHRPKSAINVGGALRACACYGAAMLVVRGRRYRRAAPDTTAAYRDMPLLHVDDLHAVIPFDCVPVAVELLAGARPLPTYIHPERAFYVFGPEDGTLGHAVTDWCRDVIMVPTRHCMNLAATVNVVLYDRLAKQEGA